MKGSSLTSKHGSLVCPICEAGELRPCGRNSAHCCSCGSLLSGAMLQALRQMVTDGR
jgi:hypothetical protein